MQNEYITKFEKLTNIELQQILTNKSDYQDEAIEAATFIFERRQPEIIEEFLKAEHQLLEFEQQHKVSFWEEAFKQVKDFFSTLYYNRKIDDYCFGWG
jgi:hypothetical protein